MPRTPKQFEEIRERTRNKILDSSLKLFATKGYHGTSINDISKEAGISKGLAYNYFSSKKDIMFAVLKRLSEIGDEMIKGIDWDSDPYQAIQDMISLTFETIERNEDFWKMYFSFSLQPAVMEESQEVSGEFAEIFFTKFEELLKKIGLPNAEEEAKLLGAIVDGVGFHNFYLKNYPLTKVKNYLLKKYSKEELDKVKR